MKSLYYNQYDIKILGIIFLIRLNQLIGIFTLNIHTLLGQIMK